MTDAYTAAKAMKDACGSISDLTGLAETAYKNGEVLDYGDILVTKGQLDKNFEDWAYDENRTDGELDIIYSPDFGYFVIGYIRTEKQISGLLTDIAMKELTNIALEEANSGVHDFHTDDEYLPAPAAPTATPVPDIELTDDGTAETSFNPEATEASAPVAQNPQNGSTKTADVLVVVFFTLAGVAIAAIIAVLIYSAVNNRIKSSGVSRENPDDDPDDNADETENDSGEDREDGSDEDDESEEDGDEDDEDNED